MLHGILNYSSQHSQLLLCTIVDLIETNALLVCFYELEDIVALTLTYITLTE